jgi:hypothetical protein
MDDHEAFLVNLEESFYQRGLESGLPHGQLHGLFEGRALGKEKGWELWEEVGYYEGVSRFWRALLIAQGKQDGRCVLRLLLPSRLADSCAGQGVNKLRTSPRLGRFLPHGQ